MKTALEEFSHRTSPIYVHRRHKILFTRRRCEPVKRAVWHFLHREFPSLLTVAHTYTDAVFHYLDQLNRCYTAAFTRYTPHYVSLYISTRITHRLTFDPISVLGFPFLLVPPTCLQYFFIFFFFLMLSCLFIYDHRRTVVPLLVVSYAWYFFILQCWEYVHTYIALP